MSSPNHQSYRPHDQHERPLQPRIHTARRRVVRHRVLAWMVVMLLLAAAAPTAFYACAHGADRPSEQPTYITQHIGVDTSPQPADRFMQSIVSDDGALGWRQLCPSVQRLLPFDTVVKQAGAQRIALAKQGVRLTVRFARVYPQRDGGVSREYMVTAHWPGGTTQTRTYIVLTQPGGCVEDVQNP